MTSFTKMSLRFKIPQTLPSLSLYLHLELDTEEGLHIKPYDKRDNFPFPNSQLPVHWQ